jgi:UDP-N-acetylmuramate dehydrogenase
MSIIHQNHSLKNLNSFGVEVYASLYASPTSVEELKRILENYDDTQNPLLVMGEGSNLLFTKNFEGLVVSPGMMGIELLEESESEVLVKVGAGESWDNWVNSACQKGWFGLENLSLIPGSVGSAPVQNIGAYGVELKDHFEGLEAWDLKEKMMVEFNAQSCRFGYRSSVFKGESSGRFIITSVSFRLSKIPVLKLDYGKIAEAFKVSGGSTPMDLRQVVIDIRNQKLPDPEQIGNSGSFFKNPVVDRPIFKCIRVEHSDIPSYPDVDNQVKIPAAWLIEKAGWKGKRIGNVGTWPSQALVIVNHGGASGLEILDFSTQIQESVEKTFSITLEREVNVV